MLLTFCPSPHQNSHSTPSPGSCTCFSPCQLPRPFTRYHMTYFNSPCGQWPCGLLVHIHVPPHPHCNLWAQIAFYNIACHSCYKRMTIIINKPSCNTTHYSYIHDFAHYFHFPLPVDFLATCHFFHGGPLHWEQQRLYVKENSTYMIHRVI